MTLAEWCDSAYNTKGFYVENERVYTPNGKTALAHEGDDPDGGAAMYAASPDEKINVNTIFYEVAIGDLYS